MSRCTGHCCKLFPLPHSLNHIMTIQDQVQDGNIIADMIIFRGVGEYSDGVRSYLYDCRHHDPKTGDCLNYAGRPRMCSEYPYGNPCRIDGCTEGSRPDVPLSRLRERAVIRTGPP